MGGQRHQQSGHPRFEQAVQAPQRAVDALQEAMHGAALGPTVADEARQPRPAHAAQHLRTDQNHQRPTDRAADPGNRNEGRQDRHEQEHTERALLQILQDLAQQQPFLRVTVVEHRQEGTDTLVAVLRPRRIRRRRLSR